MAGMRGGNVWVSAVLVLSAAFLAGGLLLVAFGEMLEAQPVLGVLACGVALVSGVAGARLRRAERACRTVEEDLRRAHNEVEERVRQRTAELRASEERLARLADALPQIIWTADAR